MSSNKVKLGAHEVELIRPTSYAVREDIKEAGTHSFHRVMYACIGLCWPKSERVLKVSLAGCRYDVLAYGGEVSNALQAAGASTEEISAAGVIAYRLITRGKGISADEVSAAEDFSESEED